MSLQSGFINIGTSGKTVDDRVIEASWLKEAAASYDPKFYTAVIDLNHWNPVWAGSYGKVLGVKLSKNDAGEVVLLANIEPNEKLVAMSKKEVLFTSMSLMPDFRGSGKHYLCALAVTPKPASVGTDQLLFSANSGSNEKSVNTDFVRVELTFSESTNDDTDDQRMFARLMNHFSKNQKPTDDQETEMSKELEKKVDALTEQVTSFISQQGASDAQNPTAADFSVAEKLLAANGYSVQKEASVDDVKAAQELLKAQGFSVEKEASDDELKAAQDLLKDKGFSIAKPASDDGEQGAEFNLESNATITRKEFEVLAEKFKDAKTTEFNFTPSSDQLGAGDDYEYL